MGVIHWSHLSIFPTQKHIKTYRNKCEKQTRENSRKQDLLLFCCSLGCKMTEVSQNCGVLMPLEEINLISTG